MSFFYNHNAIHFLKTLRKKGKRVVPEDIEPRDFQWNDKYVFFLFKKVFPIISYLNERKIKFGIFKSYDFDENEFYSLLEIDFVQGQVTFEFSKDLIYQDFSLFCLYPNFQSYYSSDVQKIILLLKEKI